MKPSDPCPSVAARQKQDLRRGHTTSDKAIDFVRRTCSCDYCKAWREERKQAVLGLCEEIKSASEG